ncbi:activating transcription factor 7-interacting protein 1 [Trichoplusia ni]|uniref:Activating transcription factor 7-interacting protein 1 n=1 Tax=Trichoplusia ni TaxID=7111 RepID=A0A7E5VZQ0_TRINI|nr:activating transcription factor 7-interacting protein 1 [Trichoplusia ni]XP_026733804.1 activating transcription factor 7-interacting protein 1 [Trichoplusia ni]
MQLILESEPTLSVDTDMSTIEDIQTEKVGKGDINDLNTNTCNGNKENIGDVNVIVNDDLNKQAIEEVEVLNSDDSINRKSLKETQIEESQNGATSETNDVNEIQDEGNNELQGTEEEVNEDIKENHAASSQDNGVGDITEDEEDIIHIKAENFEEITIVHEETEKLVLQNGSTNEKEDVSLSKDDIELIEEDVETQVKTETNPNDDVELVEERETGNSTETSLKTESPKVPKNDDVELIDEPETHITDLTETPISVTTEENTNKAQLERDDVDSNKEIVDNRKVEDEIDNKEPQIVQDSSSIELKEEMDVEEIVDKTPDSKEKPEVNDAAPINSKNVDKPVCRLSNTLDILSDDEEELPSKESEAPKAEESSDKQCINIEDDDDIMLIDEDTCKTETPKPVDTSNNVEDTKSDGQTDLETSENTFETEDKKHLPSPITQKELTPPPEVKPPSFDIDMKQEENEMEKPPLPGIPLLPENFVKTAKKNLSDMTRDDLEEFCILKIVESIVDRSSLSEIKVKLKSLSQALEEQKKKALAIAKQNRDLQVVLKSVQEEQKKNMPETCITPLKITRSVGLQVIMEKSGARRKPPGPTTQPQATNNAPANRQNIKNSPSQSPRQNRPGAQAIPVPRLVPASNTAKTPSAMPQLAAVTPNKTATAMPNGVKNPSPSQKAAEKRQLSKSSSVTVDLTDDEPPAKMSNRNSPAPPVRLVPSQNLMAPRQQVAAASNSSTPKKVYIPISCPINQSIRPGQTVVLKPVPTPGLRPRGIMSQSTRGSAGAVRLQSVNKLQNPRHPAPLPDAMKQYQPPNWKALPPAPDLKLSKVENGIVISWKIEGYQEDSYEEIASYQLYAYQETSCPPNTSLWKKIGDVKALPLPMACTLTQFMAGFKYYFAVRAVDIRSRLGPFSLPGSILLLNKL